MSRTKAEEKDAQDDHHVRHDDDGILEPRRTHTNPPAVRMMPVTMCFKDTLPFVRIVADCFRKLDRRWARSKRICRPSEVRRREQWKRQNRCSS